MVADIKFQSVRKSTSLHAFDWVPEDVLWEVLQEYRGV